MSAVICLAPARTLAYSQGGGHLWVYLQWALGLRALGCRVIWLEGMDPREPGPDPRGRVATLKGRLKPYGLPESVPLFRLNAEPLPPELAEFPRALAPAPGADRR